MENPEIIRENQKAVGFIDLLIPDTNNPQQGKRSIRGTGFVIDKNGTFATNAHVYLEILETQRNFLGINLISKIDKGIQYYNRYPIKLISMDKENDVAMFELSDGVQFEPVKKLGSLEYVVEGDDLLILGHPLATELMVMNFGITPIANRCIVSSIKRKGQDASFHFFLVDTHINLGSSGSPVFSKQTGEVVGIASGRIGMKIPLPNQQENKMFEIPANIGICRPIDYLKELINKQK